MNANPVSPNRATVRQEVWDFASEHYPCLIDVARSVAEAKTEPPRPDKQCQLCPNQECPKPINYLVNAAPPDRFPTGLTSLLAPGYVLAGSKTCLTGLPPSTPVFNGCNFALVGTLADAKHQARLASASAEQLRGFGLDGKAGLSILLGPWADYCLWCWSQDSNIKKDPILILGKDNSPFSEETIVAGQDWGADQVMDTALVTGAKDKSTQRLFGAFEKWKPPIVDYIGRERILVCNTWPWFRCGQESSGDRGIHSDFSKVPTVMSFLTALINRLRPRKILCLGSWAGSFAKAHSAPRIHSWVVPLAGATPVKLFPHPSSSSTGKSWGWPDLEADFLKELV